MQAVVEIGGQQYLVAKGDEIVVDYIETDKKTIDLPALLIFDEKTTHIGTPLIDNSKVKFSIIDSEFKGKKVQIMKFQAKKRVSKLTGHRQLQTRIKLDSISVKQ